MINHFLSLSSFSVPELELLLKRAHYFSLQSKNPKEITTTLKNKVIANVFYEPSTRTRCSFEIAAKRLGAEVINFTPENSSVKKGETIYDTLKTLESLGVDGIVFRHSDDHIFETLQSKFTIPLINAGAGKNEHPSQGLLDLLTLQQEFGTLKGLKISVCGDVKHSRVAGSLIVAAEKWGMEIFLCGPEDFLPQTYSSVCTKRNFDEALKESQAVMMLRIQLERQEGIEMDAKAYHKNFGLDSNRVHQMKKDAIILHPGPFNRGVEIADEVVEHKQSRIFKQMSNGVFARMSLLEWALTPKEGLK